MAIADVATMLASYGIGWCTDGGSGLLVNDVNMPVADVSAFVAHAHDTRTPGDSCGVSISCNRMVWCRTPLLITEIYRAIKFYLARWSSPITGVNRNLMA